MIHPQPQRLLHLSAAMSSRKHKGTVHNLANFSSRSLDVFAGSKRTIPRRGNSYFGFGYQATQGLSAHSTVLNKSLLEPLQLDLDPSIYAIKVQEKEQLKTLNDRFVSFIDKVIHLEQRNKMLETKLQMLQNGPQPKFNMESVFQMYIRTLQSQLKTLNTSEELLKAELQSIYSLVEENTNKYEEELNKRYKVEKDFVFVKKDVDDGYFSRMKLEAEMSVAQQYLDFSKALYREKVRELKERLKETSVVVEMDNSRQLNMKQVVKEVKIQYEEVLASSQKEAEDWYKKKAELVSSKVKQHGLNFKNTKNEISKINRQITNLQADITHVKDRCKSIDRQIEEAEHHGKETVFGAKQKLKDLETALQKTKYDIIGQVREYQELLNVKLALDIEIATYKKLLEGEEKRTDPKPIRVLTLPKPNRLEPVTTIICTKVFLIGTHTQQ